MKQSTRFLSMHQAYSRDTPDFNFVDLSSSCFAEWIVMDMTKYTQ
jgi:hypothetical protein